MKRIISGSRPIPLLTGRVWFKNNQVFSGFGVYFLKSNMSSGRIQVLLLSPCLNYISKYFIIILFYTLI